MAGVRKTLYQAAMKYVGVREMAGDKDHPLIQWWLSLCGGFDGEAHDEVNWCSAFMVGMAWELGYSSSRSALARSWLNVGIPIQLEDAVPGEDIVIYKRGTQPWMGHVHLFSSWAMGASNVYGLGGNQGNSVSIAPMLRVDVLGVRRLILL